MLLITAYNGSLYSSSPSPFEDNVPQLIDDYPPFQTLHPLEGLECIIAAVDGSIEMALFTEWLARTACVMYEYLVLLVVTTVTLVKQKLLGVHRPSDGL
jgi:hypothetical protein